MPDIKTLHIGDSIRLLSVPKSDLKQREQEQAQSNNTLDDMLPTATVIEMAIQQRPVVIIDQIDEYQNPWYSINLKVGKEMQWHTLAVMDSESWELVYSPVNNALNTAPKEHLIAEVMLKIDNVMNEYLEEYLELAEYSENRTKPQEQLKLLYQQLDEKTGLNTLFATLASLKEAHE